MNSLPDAWLVVWGPRPDQRAVRLDQDRAHSSAAANHGIKVPLHMSEEDARMIAEKWPSTPEKTA